MTIIGPLLAVVLVAVVSAAVFIICRRRRLCHRDVTTGTRTDLYIYILDTVPPIHVV